MKRNQATADERDKTCVDSMIPFLIFFGISANILSQVKLVTTPYFAINHFTAFVVQTINHLSMPIANVNHLSMPIANVKHLSMPIANVNHLSMSIANVNHLSMSIANV
ncbi:C-type lectin domain family 4 member E [Biomphalaria glabrata]